MFLYDLCFFALLVIPVFTKIDCSHEDTCFGEPQDCKPDLSCKTLFHFDNHGNLDLYLRNFTDKIGYAAFAVTQHADDTYEYFLCIPHEGQRHRALAELGDAVLVTEQNLTGVVEKLGNDYFRCSFNSSELPKTFQQDQVFFVSSGIFDEAMVIFDGVQLYNLDNEYEEELDEEVNLANVHPISPVSKPGKLPTLTGGLREMRAMPEIEAYGVELETFVKEDALLDGRRLESSDEDQEDEEYYNDDDNSEYNDKPVISNQDVDDSIEKLVDEIAQAMPQDSQGAIPSHRVNERIRPARHHDIIEENEQMALKATDHDMDESEKQEKAYDYPEYDTEIYDNQITSSDSLTKHTFSFLVFLIMFCRHFLFLQ